MELCTGDRMPDDYRNWEDAELAGTSGETMGRNQR